MGILGLVLLLSLVAILAGWWGWQWNRVRQTKRWPVTEATIESGRLEAYGEHGLVQLPTFAFSYKVAGEFYSGRFSLMPYTTDPGESILISMIGRTPAIAVQSEPAGNLVPDNLIEGCQVQQKRGFLWVGIILKIEHSIPMPAQHEF